MTPIYYRHSGAGAMFILAFVSALAPIMATDAKAVNMDVTPSIRLEEGWNSNAYNTATDEISSFGTRLTPGLALGFTSPDLVRLQISGDYEIVRYHDPEAKAADSDTWFFRINSTGGWALTPSLTMEPSVFYVNTTNSSRRTQLVPSGDPVVPPVTITNYGNTATTDLGGGIRFTYAVTPNTSIALSGNYSEQRFKDANDNTTGAGLTNSATAGGGASVSYLFSPRTTLGIAVAYSLQTFQNEPDTNVLSAGILFGYQFSPAFRIDGVFGMSHASQESSPTLPVSSESAPSGVFGISYASEGFTARAYGSAVYSGGSGYGSTTRQYTAGLAFTDQFAMEWSWNLSGTYQVSQSVFVADAVSSNTTTGTAGLSYRPLQWASLDLTGNLDRQTSDGQFGDTLTSYSAILGVTIGKSYKIF